MVYFKAMLTDKSSFNPFYSRDAQKGNWQTVQFAASDQGLHDLIFSLGISKSHSLTYLKLYIY